MQKQTGKNVVDTTFKLLVLRKGWRFQNLNFKSLKNSSLKKAPTHTDITEFQNFLLQLKN